MNPNKPGRAHVARRKENITFAVFLSRARMSPIGIYAVKHVNRIDVHIPPKKNANQARIVEAPAFWLVDKKIFGVQKRNN